MALWKKNCDADRILIADDDVTIRKVFTMILSHSFQDLAIEEAANGLEAVRMFQEHHPAIIIMDLRMPEMDGLTAVLTIQEICAKENRQMPAIIFCTGFVPPEGVNKIVGDGTYHTLLHKPAKSQEIIDCVTSRRAQCKS